MEISIIPRIIMWYRASEHLYWNRGVSDVVADQTETSEELRWVQLFQQSPTSLSPISKLSSFFLSGLANYLVRPQNMLHSFFIRNIWTLSRPSLGHLGRWLWPTGELSWSNLWPASCKRSKWKSIHGTTVEDGVFWIGGQWNMVLIETGAKLLIVILMCLV